jgi:hypothetical protein
MHFQHSQAAREIFQKYQDQPEEVRRELEQMIIEKKNEDATSEMDWKKKQLKLADYLKANSVTFPKKWKFNREELYDRI